MKLKYLFETVDMGNEIVAVPVGENADQVKGVLRINREAKEIMDRLICDTTEKDIVEYLEKKYESSSESISLSVNGFVQSLRDAGLLIE